MACYFDPSDLGFPPTFQSFRPAQEEAIEHCLTTDKRFAVIGAPPGVGKSGIALAIAKLLGGRTVILTASLGLEQQYLASLGSTGLVNIHGRSNYSCWEGGTCEDGGLLGCGDQLGCPYKIAFRAQNQSEIVITNYAYWLAVHDKGQGLRPTDTLICDEAGLAHDWLSRAVDFTITERECRGIGEKLKPTPGEDIDEWARLSVLLLNAAVHEYESLMASKKATSGSEREKLAREIKRAESLLDRTRRLAALDDNWVCTKEEGTHEGRQWKFEAIRPGKYRERLFRGIKRIILLSATIRPKTLSLLGIPRADYDFREWGRQFPAANGPVIYIPTVKLNHRMSDADRRVWLQRIESILTARNDRRGIIHTVSYARAKEIADKLSASHWIKLNGAADPNSRSAREAFESFIAGPKNGILCSPSFSTGWDFAGKHAEYQIIAKLPIVDTRSKVMQARVASDSGYADYLAAQELVQACGRVVRSDVDRGETFIVDDAWKWFGNKAADHMPKWFKVRKEETMPKAPPALK